VRVHVRMCVNACVHVCMCMCTHAYTKIRTYVHTHTHTHTHTFSLLPCAEVCRRPFAVGRLEVKTVTPIRLSLDSVGVGAAVL